MLRVYIFSIYSYTVARWSNIDMLPVMAAGLSRREWMSSMNTFSTSLPNRQTRCPNKDDTSLP